MAKSYKIVGQAAPVADTDTVLYTVAALKEFVAAGLTAVNRSPTAAVSIRIALVPSGEVLGNQHYIEYDMLLDGRESKRIPINIGMDQGTKVYVRSSTAYVSFTLGGAVIDK